MIATLADHLKAEAMRRSNGRFTRATFRAFKRTIAALNRGDMAGASVSACRDLEMKAIWLDAMDRQRQAQAVIVADFSKEAR